MFLIFTEVFTEVFTSRKEIQNIKANTPLIPRNGKACQKRKETTALHSNSIEFAGIKNESRVLPLISIGQDVLVRQGRPIGSCGTHSHPSSVLKGKPSEDGDSSREGFGSRGEPLKSLSLK